MHAITCPGLPASWVNAWIAAVGTTVLDRRIRLHWTEGDAPVAVLSTTELDPVQALVQSWPDEAFLRDLPIAEKWGGDGELRRNVLVDQVAARVSKARSHPYSWTLSWTMTDLGVNHEGKVAHAPFDPFVPRGLTLHDRLLKVHREAGPASQERLRRSLMGKAERVGGNGLGFDITRISSLGDTPDKWIEPVVECLAFFGLAMLPVRARGVDHQRGGNFEGPDERQRGWRRVPGSKERRRFDWPAWRQPLDAAGIDALLDGWNPWRRRTWARFGVHTAWRTVRYIGRGDERTVAFGSEML